MLSGTWELDEPQAPDHGYRTGRIKLGTESSGGFKNITVTNCIFEHCRGLALETVDGGHLEDIEISHITMRHSVNAGIFLRLGARMRSPEGTPAGSMKRIRISHINAYDVDSRYSSIISGIPNGIIEDVTFDHIHLYYKGGYTKEDGKENFRNKKKYILNRGCLAPFQQKASTFHMLRISRFITSISIMRNRMDVLYS